MLAAFGDSKSLPQEILNIICSDFDISSVVNLSTVNKNMLECMQNLTAAWLRTNFPKMCLDNQIPNVLPYLKSINWYFSHNNDKTYSLSDPTQLREILYSLWIIQCYFLPEKIPQLDVNSLFPEAIPKQGILRCILDFAAKNNLICVLERFLDCANLEISAEERQTLLREIFIASACTGRLEVVKYLKDAPEISRNLEYITNFHSIFEKAARRGDTDMLIFLKESTKIKPFCLNAALELAKRNNQEEVIDLFSSKGWLNEIEESVFCSLQEPQCVELTFSSNSSKSKKSSRHTQLKSDDSHERKDKREKKRDNCCIQ